MQQVGRLIRWLTHVDPARRPTAREVLRSELLPPRVGDEQLVDLLRTLPSRPAHQMVLCREMFSIECVTVCAVMCMHLLLFVCSCLISLQSRSS